MAAKNWHLVSYDIRDPKRLRKVAKLLEGYGVRMQYSVFRCRLDSEMLEELHWRLGQVMAPEDDLLVVPLCGRCAAKVPKHSTGDQTSWAEPPPSYKVV